MKEIQRLYASINYAGRIHPVKITVKVIKREGNKAYSYEVMEIENPDRQLSYPGNPPAGDIGNLVPKTADFFPQSTGLSSSSGQTDLKQEP